MHRERYTIYVMVPTLLPTLRLITVRLLILLLHGLAMVLSPAGAKEYTPLYQNDPCRAVLVDGQRPAFLHGPSAYTAGHCQQLSRGVVLAWAFEGDRVRFEIHANTEGWVSVGINKVGSMLGADVTVGWVNDDGVGFLFDAKNDDKVKQAPVVDDRQDTELLQSRQKNSVTSLHFSRPIVSDDPQDTDIRGRTWVVWAFGTEDPEDDSMEYLGFHVREGIASIRFFDAPPETPQQANDEL